MNILRFVSQSQYKELIEFYHLARVPLAGQKCGKYERMIQACKWFHEKYPSISETACYKDLSANLEGY